MLPAPLLTWVPSFASGASAAFAPRQPGAAPAGAVSGPCQLGAPGEIKVTVVENSPASVINLNSVFAAVRGLQHQDGLQMSLMGNTNPGLVRADLSKAVLTLHYAPGQSGTATIVVAATDADGVCAKENILVTVLPLLRRPGTATQVSLPGAAKGPATPGA